MTLADKLAADYDARRRMVPVMGIEVWVTPLTLAEQTNIAAKHPDDSAMRMAETFVQKCRDADGKALFTKDDKVTLARRVAGDALSPLIAAIVGPSTEAQAAEMTAKNPEADDQPST